MVKGMFRLVSFAFKKIKCEQDEIAVEERTSMLSKVLLCKVILPKRRC